jgi:DNA-binding NarL/FixJ family response regulator
MESFVEHGDAGGARRLFRLLIRGATNNMVARELCIGIKTVESHRGTS